MKLSNQKNCKFLFSLKSSVVCFLKISTKPPICCCFRAGRATELFVKIVVVVEIIFACYCTRSPIKLASWMWTNHVGTSSPRYLPPPCSAIGASVTSNVGIFNFLASARTPICHDIEIGEFCSHIVGVINAIVRKVAGSSPVCRDWGKVFHSCYAHAVCVPVGRQLVHWGVSLQE